MPMARLIGQRSQDLEMTAQHLDRQDRQAVYGMLRQVCGVLSRQITENKDVERVVGLSVPSSGEREKPKGK